MKISSFDYTPLDLSSHAQQKLNSVLTLIEKLGNVVKSRTSKSFMQFKINRLSSALYSMSDYQLDKVGLSRKDIKHHAESLIKYEYDGL